MGILTEGVSYESRSDGHLHAARGQRVQLCRPHGWRPIQLLSTVGRELWDREQVGASRPHMVMTDRPFNMNANHMVTCPTSKSTSGGVPFSGSSIVYWQPLSIPTDHDAIQGLSHFPRLSERELTPLRRMVRQCFALDQHRMLPLVGTRSTASLPPPGRVFRRNSGQRTPGRPQNHRPP